MYFKIKLRQHLLPWNAPSQIIYICNIEDQTEAQHITGKQCDEVKKEGRAIFCSDGMGLIT